MLMDSKQGNSRLNLLKWMDGMQKVMQLPYCLTWA